MKPISWILAAVVLAGILGYIAFLNRKVTVPQPNAKEEVATFAGGCFWCIEATFEEQAGVRMAVSGYVGHREAVQVIYDPELVSYQDLLAVFWRNIDPTDAGGQFVDRGSSYTTAIFYHSPEQQQEAERSRRALIESGRFPDPVVTEVLAVEPFRPASAAHQDFYRCSPLRYRTYRRFSGRDDFFSKTWPTAEPALSQRESERSSEWPGR